MKRRSRPAITAGPTPGSHRYLPVDAGLARYEVYLTGVGRSTSPAGGRYPQPGHPSVYDFQWSRGRVLPEYAIVVIHRGNGSLESRGTGTVPLQAGSALLIPPGAWHRYRPDPRTGWEELWLCLNGELLHRWSTKRLLPREPACVHIAHPQPLVEQINAILHAADDCKAGNSPLLSAMALQALLTVAEALDHDQPLPETPPHDQPQSEDPLVSHALLYIWNNAHRQLSIPQIAKALAVHPRTLERRFRSAAQPTIIRCINDCRLSRAKDLLRSTTLPTKQIAFTVGYANPKRFAEAFRAGVGCTPLTYRRQTQAPP